MPQNNEASTRITPCDAESTVSRTGFNRSTIALSVVAPLFPVWATTDRAIT